MRAPAGWTGGMLLVAAVSIWTGDVAAARTGHDVPDAAALALKAPGLRPHVLAHALDAYREAVARGAVRRHVLTIVDYTLPSSAKRLWVFDLAHEALVFREFVAHGKGSGGLRARAFSNQSGSRMSSLGLFATGETYRGKHGYSLRLHGLDPGVNDRAEARAIVVHGAWYVSDGMAQRADGLGRSWGCLALRPDIARPLIDTIKDGSAVYAYYRD